MTLYKERKRKYAGRVGEKGKNWRRKTEAPSGPAVKREAVHREVDRKPPTWEEKKPAADISEKRTPEKRESTATAEGKKRGGPSRGRKA